MSASDPFHHVRDANYFELPRGLHIDLPEIAGFQVTKFMVLQVIAAVIVFVIFKGLAKRARTGQPVAGRFWNFWEAIALFLRDELIRPTIGDGHHDHGHDDDHGHGDHGHDAHGHSDDGPHFADQYAPFILSCFFFILICNLLGAIPWMGSATGNINVTGVLALCAFGATTVYGVQAMGVGGFFGNLIPDTGMSGAAGLAMSIGMFLIELLGFLIKHTILALRLFGNIMGGHTALAIILGFIAVSYQHGVSTGLWATITFGSVAGQVGVGILELLVAVLQAYVFSFLATIFIAGSIHKH